MKLPEDWSIERKLHFAALTGDEKTVSSILDSGVDVNSIHDAGQGMSVRGETPLHAATRGNHLSIVKLLLSRGADVHSRDLQGETPLAKVAVAPGDHRPVVRALIEAGADINARSGDGSTALQRASFHGDKSVVDLLIAYGAEVDLCVAVGLDDPDTAERLLRTGADVNGRGLWHQTPLHWASTRGSYTIARMLLDHGAGPRLPNVAGSTPLHAAAGIGDAGIAELLVSRGADVNARADSGWTPLHAAQHGGGIEIVRLLLSHGADPDVADCQGLTPLHWAAYSEKADMASLLLSYGAMVDLHVAAALGDLASAQSMLDVGVDPNALLGADAALHLAVLTGHTAVAELLLSRGADASIVTADDRRQTPLHLLAEEGHRHPDAIMPSARVLLAHGADISARDAFGETSLDYASDCSPAELVALLQEHSRVR